MVENGCLYVASDEESGLYLPILPEPQVDFDDEGELIFDGETYREGDLVRLGGGDAGVDAEALAESLNGFSGFASCEGAADSIFLVGYWPED